MTRDELELQMGRMGALKGFPSGSDAYWEVFAAMSLAELERGVLKAIKTRAWFPAPSELLHDVEITKPAVTWEHPYRVDDTAAMRYVTITSQFGDLNLKVYRDWKYDCTRCTDSGWASWWCGKDTKSRGEWMEPSTCGRREEHGPHEWVSKCACWGSNPTLIRRRDVAAQAAATRTAKNTRGE